MMVHFEDFVTRNLVIIIFQPCLEAISIPVGDKGSFKSGICLHVKMMNSIRLLIVAVSRNHKSISKDNILTHDDAIW